MRSALRGIAVALLAAAAGCHKHARVESVRGEEIAITASEPGASAEELETAVAVPIEDAVAAIAHVAHVHTQVEPGRVVVAVELEPGADADAAATEANAGVARILSRLPVELGPPTIMRGLPSTDVVRYTLRSEQLTLTQLTELDERIVRRALERVPGVVGVESCGGAHTRWLATVDPQRLAALDLSFGDVATAVRATNLVLPAGSISAGGQTIAVRTTADEDPSALRQLVIATRAGQPWRLGDVADVRDAPEHLGCLASDNGIRVIADTVQARRGSDADDTRAAIEKALVQARAALPAGTTLDELPSTRPVELEAGVDRIERAEQVVEVLRPIPSVSHVLLEARPGTARVTLYPTEDADPRTLEARASEALRATAVEAHGRAALAVQIIGPDRAKLAELAGAAAGALAAHHLEVPGGTTPRVQPRLDYHLDRDAIARYGVSERDVTDAIRALTDDGLEVATMRSGSGGEKPIVLAFAGGHAEPLDHRPEQLDQVVLRGATGVPVPVSQLVRVEERTGAAALLREDRQPCIAVPVVGDADAVHAALAGLALPPGYRWQLAAAPR